MSKTDELPERVLHRKFAKLHEADDNNIIKFANKYGLLGYEVLLTSVDKGEILIGESISRWKFEISQLNQFLKLWDLILDQPDIEKLRSIVSWEDDRITIKMDSSKLLLSDLKLKYKVELFHKFEKGNIVEPVKFFICREINQKLKGQLSPQVLPFLSNDVYNFPVSLISAIWLMFLWEVSGKSRITRCKICEKWFDFKDKRMKYCSEACKQQSYRNNLLKKKK